MLRYFKKKKDVKDKEISLIVESTSSEAPFVMKVPKSSLMKHSAIFRKMAENGEFKKSKEIKLKNITSTALQKMVQYMKTESVFFQSHFEAIETWKAAYLYQVEAMNSICSDFLITAMKSDNVCDIYEFASSYSFQQVEFYCLKYIDFHADDILKSSSFLQLKERTVVDIIKRHTLNVKSEMAVFRAVLSWSFNDCLKQKIDTDNAEEYMKSMKPLLACVRFSALSDEEMSDPEVDKYYKLLCSQATANKRPSIQSMEHSGSYNSNDYKLLCYQATANKRPSIQSVEHSGRSNSVDYSTMHMQPREYVPDNVYELAIADTDFHPVKNGETFCLRFEVLKGRMFLTGATLAFDRFVDSKNASCFYVALSATNLKTADHVSARGAFMMCDEEAAVKFAQPLIVKESENVELTLKVKRAINISAMKIKSESQIVVTQGKDIALKITPCASTGETERSMFRGLKYFY